MMVLASKVSFPSPPSLEKEFVILLSLCLFSLFAKKLSSLKMQTEYWQTEQSLHVVIALSQSVKFTLTIA
jgi:hypothetical protein